MYCTCLLELGYLYIGYEPIQFARAIPTNKDRQDVHVAS